MMMSVIAEVGARRLSMDADARAHRDLGRLRERAAAGQQDDNFMS
jgi:hypothetical protein